MTGYLLDTNIISETRKTQANPGVVKFLTNVDSDRLFISVITLGELHRGVQLKQQSDPSAAKKLRDWVHEIETTFADRILLIDATIARLWGQLSAKRSLPVVDTLIAATALRHDLTLVTRNIKDVKATSVITMNPWQC